MNQLINSDNLTMSTISLCEVINTFRTESNQNEIRYFDFIARVEDELDDLKPNEIFVNPSNKKEMKFYSLNKDQTLLVGMRESKVVRKKVLAWIKSLELPTTFGEALQLAANQALKIETQNKLIALQAPAVKFVEDYTQAETGSKGFRQVAKLLKANERVFREFLVDMMIMYKSKSGWMAYQRHVDANRFEVITGEKNSHIYNEVLFTGKGINWVAGLWAIELIALGEEK